MAKVAELANGVRFLAENNDNHTSVSCAIWVKAGSRYEESNKGGVYHLIEHLLFQGTNQRPSAKEISDAIEGIGGIINAFTSSESTCFLAKVPAYRQEQALDVLFDLITDPLFREEDFLKEKRVILEEIKLHNDQPQDKAEMLLFSLLFPEHPLGRDIAGNEETVQKISLEDTKEAFTAAYCASNIVVALAGSIREKRLKEIADFYLNKLPKGDGLPYSIFQGSQIKALKTENRETEEVHISLGTHTFGRSDPRRYALDVLNTLLGVGASSRLYQEIREKRGLAYYILSSLTYFDEIGCQVISAGCSPQHVDTVFQLIFEEMEKIKHGLSTKELQRAKEYIKGSFLLRIEDTLSQALWLGEKLLLEGKVDTFTEEVAKYDRVSEEEVLNLAKEIFQPYKYAGVAVGPYKEVKSEWPPSF